MSEKGSWKNIKSEAEGCQLLLSEVFAREHEPCRKCIYADCHLGYGHSSPHRCKAYRIIDRLLREELEWLEDRENHRHPCKGALLLRCGLDEAEKKG
jgi:hypothetical protein